MIAGIPTLESSITRNGKSLVRPASIKERGSRSPYRKILVASGNDNWYLVTIIIDLHIIYYCYKYRPRKHAVPAYFDYQIFSRIAFYPGHTLKDILRYGHTEPPIRHTSVVSQVSSLSRGKRESRGLYLLRPWHITNNVLRRLRSHKGCLHTC